MTPVTRPSPTVDPDTQGYWASTGQGRFALQICNACGQIQHFPSAICRACWSFDLSYRALSGRGRVYTFVTVHHVTTPGYADRAPYVVAWIAIAEHPEVRVLGVVDSPADHTVTIDDEVMARFPPASDGFVVPEFDLVVE